MSDEQHVAEQPGQQAPAYPGFVSTHAGLAQLHQEVGRLWHLVAEAGILDAERRGQAEQLHAAIEHLRANHLPGMCQPVPKDEVASETAQPIDEPVPMRARGG